VRLGPHVTTAMGVKVCAHVAGQTVVPSCRARPFPAVAERGSPPNQWWSPYVPDEAGGTDVYGWTQVPCAPVAPTVDGRATVLRDDSGTVITPHIALLYTCRYSGLGAIK
jgi:hypothetical protein